jgi:hypothetical protein
MCVDLVSYTCFGFLILLLGAQLLSNDDGTNDDN